MNNLFATKISSGIFTIRENVAKNDVDVSACLSMLVNDTFTGYVIPKKKTLKKSFKDYIMQTYTRFGKDALTQHILHGVVFYDFAKSRSAPLPHIVSPSSLSIYVDPEASPEKRLRAFKKDEYGSESREVKVAYLEHFPNESGSAKNYIDAILPLIIHCDSIVQSNMMLLRRRAQPDVFLEKKDQDENALVESVLLPNIAYGETLQQKQMGAMNLKDDNMISDINDQQFSSLYSMFSGTQDVKKREFQKLPQGFKIAQQNLAASSHDITQLLEFKTQRVRSNFHIPEKQSFRVAKDSQFGISTYECNLKNFQKIVKHFLQEVYKFVFRENIEFEVVKRTNYAATIQDAQEMHEKGYIDEEGLKKLLSHATGLPSEHFLSARTLAVKSAPEETAEKEETANEQDGENNAEEAPEEPPKKKRKRKQRKKSGS